MLSQLLGCIAGKAQDLPQTWEAFSGAQDPDDYCAGEWSNLIVRAKQMGVEVKFTPKGIKMTHGRSEGLFRDYQGGVKLAGDFLDSIA